MILGLTVGGVELLIKVLVAPALEIGDDVAGVAPIGADFDPGDYAALLRPGLGGIGECLEPAQLLAELAGVARNRQRLQGQDVLRQTAVFGQAEDIAQPESLTQVKNLRRCVMTVPSREGVSEAIPLTHVPSQVVLRLA